MFFQEKGSPGQWSRTQSGVLFQVCVKGLVGWEGGMYGKLFN